jgi:prophage regulatory protein
MFESSTMAQRESQDVIKTIRRKELKEMVPLADSTIFEMEQRGEFPRRFALGPRCVVWDLREVQAWIKARRATPIARTPRPHPTSR